LLETTNLRAAARAEVESALKRFLSPQRVLLRDKLTWCCGTLSMVGAAYWLGHAPQTFYRLYTVEAGVLLLLRWMFYRWSRQHYYLFDWCYIANAMLLVHLWYAPTNVLFAKVMFAHSMGPLLWSILAFRNSIVPHSLDKMTSHFMHFLPALVCWCQRWHTSGPLAERLRTDPVAAAQWASGGMRDLVLLPMVPYLCWAVLYYLKIFVWSSRKIQQRNYDTLFKFVTSSRRSLFGAIVLRFPPGLQPIVYMAVHQLLTLLTMAFNTLWFSSQLANTAFLLCIFAASTWTGSTFYFDHFAHRYLASIGLQAKKARASSAGTPTQSTASDAAHSKKRS
jgi:hypothetical protein